jgi:hypothetical protein
MIKKLSATEWLELYKKLPRKNQLLLWEDDMASRIKKIEERFKLTKKQGDSLTEMIAYILLGALPPLEIKKAIVNEFLVEEEFAQKISDEIFRSIIFPSKPLLKEIYEEKHFKIEDGETEEEKEEREKKGGLSDTYREPIS